MAGSFFLIWFALSRIPFVKEGELNTFAREHERKLGALILKTITATQEKIENEKVHAVIDSIRVRICRSRNLSCDDIKIHLIRNEEINAFALPDHQIVIYSGLLNYASNAEEVAGVLAHELGHIEHRHVMKKLTKEIGLEMLFTMVGGDAGFEIARETAKLLSSTAFDRGHEQEADDYAVATLAHANIDPQHLSNFFFRLSRKTQVPEQLTWLSTHPDTKSRAADIIRKKKEFTYKTKRLVGTPWQHLRQLLQQDPGPKAE